LPWLQSRQGSPAQPSRVESISEAPPSISVLVPPKQKGLGALTLSGSGRAGIFQRAGRGRGIVGLGTERLASARCNPADAWPERCIRMPRPSCTSRGDRRQGPSRRLALPSSAFPPRKTASGTGPPPEVHRRAPSTEKEGTWTAEQSASAAERFSSQQSGRLVRRGRCG